MNIKPTYEELEEKVCSLEKERFKYNHFFKQQGFDQSLYIELSQEINAILMSTNREGIVTYITASIKNISGYSPEEVIGKSFFDFFDTKDMSKMDNAYLQIKEGRVAFNEFNINTKTGQRIWVDCYIRKIPTKDKYSGFYGILLDVTGRKESEIAIQESELKYRNILETIEEGYFEINLAGDMIYANRSLCLIFGYSSEELLKMNNREYSTPETARRMFQVYNRVYRTGKSDLFTNYEIIKKSGETVILQVSTSLLLDSDGKKIGFKGIVRDVTELNRAWDAQKISEERYKKLSEVTVEGIVFHQNGIILDVNKSFCDMVGVDKEELIGQNVIESFILPQYHTIVHEHIHIGYEKAYEVMGKRKNGELFPVRLEARKTSAETNNFRIVSAIDVTEQKKNQEIMIQTEKMVSLGGLAAGMAHEINNPLGAIIQGVQNVIRRFDPEFEKNLAVAQKIGLDMNLVKTYMEDRSILKFLGSIQESGRRAADIITNMLAFSRKSQSKIQPMDLVRIIENTLEMARKDYDLKRKFDFKNIKIIKEFDSGLKMVPCVETEIEQVILNLLNNAAQAMAEEREQREHFIILRSRIDGKMARIEVEDNGPGIDPFVIKRIFEPFYTTKPVGQGTGLGLSVSYMIVTQKHNGTLDVESEKGKGTCFIIRLPLVR